MENVSNGPVQTFRRGAVGVSIWQREGKHGPYFEFTVSRSFKKNDDEAGYTSNFRAENIEGLRIVLAEVESWLNGCEEKPAAKDAA
jgi:hypothetical protein